LVDLIGFAGAQEGPDGDGSSEVRSWWWMEDIFFRDLGDLNLLAKATMPVFAS
jgi:hypothetical protein